MYVTMKCLFMCVHNTCKRCIECVPSVSIGDNFHLYFVQMMPQIAREDGSSGTAYTYIILH